MGVNPPSPRLPLSLSPLSHFCSIMAPMTFHHVKNTAGAFFRHRCFCFFMLFFSFRHRCFFSLFSFFSSSPMGGSPKGVVWCGGVWGGGVWGVSCGCVVWGVGCDVWGVCFKIFVGASKIWAPRTLPSPDRPHFRSFFPLPPQFSFFSSLFGVFFSPIFYFSQFWWCFLKRQDPQMHTIGVLGLSCEAPASSGGGVPAEG